MSTESKNFRTEDIHHREAEGKSLSYVDEFKRVVKEHPGVLADFKKIVGEIKVRQDKFKGGLLSDDEFYSDDVISSGEITATMIDSENFRDQPEHGEILLGDYLKIEIDNHKFFVKKIPGYSKNDLSRGGHEFQSTEILREAVNGIPNVEVVDFQLGYHDKDNTYFVSKWVDGVRMKDYISSLKEIWTTHKEDGLGIEAKNKIARLRSRLAELGLMLPGFDDIGPHNAFYDEATDKITLFDVQRLYFDN